MDDDYKKNMVGQDDNEKTCAGVDFLGSASCPENSFKLISEKTACSKAPVKGGKAANINTGAPHGGTTLMIGRSIWQTGWHA